MSAYNFKAQFADAITKRTKTQTIRAERKDGRLPAYGSPLQLYTGMRTKSCRKLLPDMTCTGVQKIKITYRNGGVIVVVDGEILTADALRLFVMADGFGSVDDFENFFETQHGLPFYGNLIKWGE